MTEWTAPNITAIGALSVMILAIFFMLTREILVTGAAHRREIAAMAQQIAALRQDHDRQMVGLRADRDAITKTLELERDHWIAAYHLKDSAYVQLAQSIDDITDVMKAKPPELPPVSEGPNGRRRAAAT